MAVVECHRTIGELEAGIEVYKRNQSGRLARSVIALPVMDGPRGEINMN